MSSEKKSSLSAIEGLQMGWCLFHQMPMEGVAENKEFASDFKTLKSSFFWRYKAVQPEELQYNELVAYVLNEHRSDVKNMQKLMKSPSMDAIGAGMCVGEKIVIAQKFGLISLEEALEIHEAGRATSYKFYPIGNPRRLRLPFTYKKQQSVGDVYPEDYLTQ